MNTAEKIYQELQGLPETQAREVLGFVGVLKARQLAVNQTQREAALATLARYRGRFQSVKFDRAGLYER